MFRLRAREKQEVYNFRVWHLFLTVFVMGLTLRYTLGAIELPGEDAPGGHTGWYHGSPSHNAAGQAGWRHRHQPREGNGPPTLYTPTIQVLPFDMTGEVPGPLLTSILKRYLPQSTPGDADDLRGTLPPGENPRLIVILPEDEHVGPVY